MARLSDAESTLGTLLVKASEFLRDMIPHWQVDRGTISSACPKIGDISEHRVPLGANYLVTPGKLTRGCVRVQSGQPTFPNLSPSVLRQWYVAFARFLLS